MLVVLKYSDMLENIKRLCVELVDEFDQIPAERKDLLGQMAAYISGELALNNPVQLTYVCTHNSRRSHFGQIWSQVAAIFFGIPVQTFSAGSEVTAFNPNAIEALRSQGFNIESESAENNPMHLVYVNDDVAIRCFSKEIGHQENPQRDFIAVMTCSEADTNCPFVPGAKKRFSTTYDDPKMYDATPLQAEKYRERSRQIGRESLYMYSLVKLKSN